MQFHCDLGSSLQYIASGGAPFFTGSGPSNSSQPSVCSFIRASALIEASLPSSRTTMMESPPTLMGETNDRGGFIIIIIVIDIGIVIVFVVVTVESLPLDSRVTIEPVSFDLI